MKNRMMIVNLVLCGAMGAVVLGKVPPRPEQIQFAPLQFEAPKAAEFRHTLTNGVVVFMAPSHEFPLINIGMTFRGGDFLDPAGKTGLASMTGAMMRRGGTTSKSPSQLDEELDFLAAQVGSGAGGTTASASLNCLKSNFDQCMALFMDMVRNPGFAQERLDLYKSEVMEQLKQRNDDADSILNREWSALLYGREHFEAAEPTKASIESISREDLMAMHKRIFTCTPGNLYVAVTGDFEVKEMLSRLEQAFSGWAAGEKIADPPAPTAKFTPGMYHVEKDIPQGKVNIGLRGIKRDDPDYFALLLMNEVLGGGGFTSRITNRVRSDEGLAYHASSALMPRVYYPGEFRAEFQSKNPTVALAAKIVMEEIDRMRNELVPDKELQVAKDSFIETFPRTFESKAGKLGVFIGDEMTNRPKDFWQTYRAKVGAVKPEDVQRVARKYLTPEAMAIMVVGNWEKIAPGDLEKRASMNLFFGGKVTELPLRDPLTLEVVK